MSDLITMKPSIGVQRHPSTSLWTKPPTGPAEGLMTRGGVYRGVGVGVSGFQRGVKEVRVSRNPVSRHPRRIPRAVFNKRGWGVVIQSKTNHYVL
jgi:hypothetical protein